MNNLIAWGAKAAPYFIALPMAIFGAQHFFYIQFVADFIPAWMPWRTFWACFTGAALIAAAVGIFFRIWDRWAATLLGTMIFLWVVLLHTSRIAAKPGDFGEWRGIFQALAISGCAWILAHSLAPKTSTSAATGMLSSGSLRLLTVLPELGARLAPYFIGISMVALGLEHFVFANVTAPQVPVWIPQTAVGNYLSGAALIALGVGVCFRRTRRQASVLLGIMIFLSMLFVHGPVVLSNNSRFESDWTKTLVLSGGAFLLAQTLTKRESSTDSKSSSPLLRPLQRTEHSCLVLAPYAKPSTPQAENGNCRLPVEAQSAAHRDEVTRDDTA